jgi:hypothetical protein
MIDAGRWENRRPAAEAAATETGEEPGLAAAQRRGLTGASRRFKARAVRWYAGARAIATGARHAGTGVGQ